MTTDQSSLLVGAFRFARNSIRQKRKSICKRKDKKKRHRADLQMNGVLQGELVNLSNDKNSSTDPLSNDKLTIEQIYEPNNNNLNQVCMQQEKLKLLNQPNQSGSDKTLNDNQENKQTKDQPDAKVDEQINLIKNLNTFNNMLQTTYKNDQTNKQHYQTLYGHHRQMNNSNSLLNTTNVSSQSNQQSNNPLSSQLSQYELKPGQSIQQYELSQEMLDKRVEVLMRKYGDKAWQAALTIQRFWRKRQMSKRFRNLALGNGNLKETTKQQLTSTSTNDLTLNDKLNTTNDQMDLMEVSNSEIIITDKTHPLNNGNNFNNSQQKLINATLEALKTPLTDSQANNNQTSNLMTTSLVNNQTKSSMTNNRSIIKRYSNASLQSTSSSGSSSNSSIPRSPTMPTLQKNIFYSSNTGSILSNCSTTPNNHSTSHILLNSSPLHPTSNLIANGQKQIIYANGNSLYGNANLNPAYSNVCLTNNLINGSIMNPYIQKSNQTTPVLTPQQSLINNSISPAYIHSINNSQLNNSGMSLQSCLSNNLSRQSILSTLSNNSLMFNGSPQQQLHQQQLAKQQQIQISQYETLRKRQYRIGLNLFNKRPPSRGIQYLINNGFIDVNLLNYAGFLIDSGLDSGLGSLTSGSSSSISTDNKQNTSTNGDQPPEREMQLAAAVARFLLTRKGLSKQMIGEYLGDLQQPFNQLVLKFFVKQLDLSGLLIDVALRRFQTYFRFPGEAQKIEKLVEVFSEKYYQCNFENGINPSLYDAYTAAAVSSGRLNLEEEANPEKIGLRVMTQDELFILSFAIIMLNTDLHVPNNKRRMTPEQWIKNLKGVFKEGDLNETFLLDIYERIKQNDFKTGHDHCNHVLKVQQTLVPSSSAKQVPNLCLTTYRRLVCFCRLYEIVDVNKKSNKLHQREVFLFNDMLLVTKLAKSGTFTGASSITNSGGHSSSASTHNQYSYRRSILLSGCTVTLFSTNHYPYGIKLMQKNGNQTANSTNSSSNNNNKCLIMFNARNDIDRKKFYEDLRESICEINEMEMIRISSTNGLSSNISSNLSSSSSTSSSSSSVSSSNSSTSNQQKNKNNPSPTHSLQPNKTISKTNSLLDLVKI